MFLHDMGCLVVINNTKGVTLFELLVSISVGSIVLIMLTSLLSSSLIAKNEIEYVNRLNNEAYMISETLLQNFQSTRFRSISESSLSNEDHYILEIIDEYSFTTDPITGEIDYTFYRNESIPHRYYIHLDLTAENNGLYYGPIEDFNQTTYTWENTSTHKINTDNITFTSDSSLEFVNCLADFQINPTQAGNLEPDLCNHALLEINLEMEYTIDNATSALPRRKISTTLFF